MITVNSISLICDEAIKVTILLILPICLSAMIVGLIVAILQAVTQIQEMTLTFIPKIIAILISIIIFMPYMSHILSTFYIKTIDHIVTAVPT